MFARWDRMAKQFSRISKEIIVAVKAGGADPHSNPALRRAVQNARQINMPKDKVEAAIKRAVGKDATSYETIIYEGYAPHGVAVIVEAATDNPTRTVASVRTIFSKNGGNLGSTGSVGMEYEEVNSTGDPATTGGKWDLWLGTTQKGLNVPDQGATGVQSTFVGSRYADTGQYRPSANSMMNSLFGTNLNTSFNSVSREQIIFTIWRAVRPVDSTEPPAGTADAPAEVESPGTLAVHVIDPEVILREIDAKLPNLFGRLRARRARRLRTAEATDA